MKRTYKVTYGYSNRGCYLRKGGYTYHRYERMVEASSAKEAIEIMKRQLEESNEKEGTGWSVWDMVFSAKWMR